MADFAPSLPPELDDVPSAEGPLPPPSDLVGRPYALPVDILGELHGPLFYADYSGFRKLYACSLELVEELCDESRFAKNLTRRWPGSARWQATGCSPPITVSRIGRRPTTS